jgi:uncharacterized protein (TIGR00266 family)
MEYRILFEEAFPMLVFKLDKGEGIYAESGAMVYMDPWIDVEPVLKGGIFSSFRRKFLGKESAFINRFVSKRDGSSVALSPSGFIGQIALAEVLDVSLKIRPGGFLAGAGDIDIEGSIGGLRTFLGMEGFEFLEIKGRGFVFFSGFGGIEELVLKGEELIVDTGHVLGFSSNLSYKVVPFGSLKTFAFSGEGLVCKFKGAGSVWVQSRSYASFYSIIKEIVGDDRKK